MKNDIMVTVVEQTCGTTYGINGNGNAANTWIGDFEPIVDVPFSPNRGNQRWTDGLHWPYPTDPPWWPNHWPLTFTTTSLLPASKFRVTSVLDKLSLALDVPGIRKGSLDVSMSGYILTVSGTRADTGVPLKESYVLTQEWNVKPTHIDACHSDGVLTVTFMKTQDMNGRVTVR